MAAPSARQRATDHRAATGAARVAFFLWQRWLAVRTAAERIHAWVNEEKRSLFGILTAIAAFWSIDAAIETFRYPTILIIVIAVPLGGLLLLRFDASLAFKDGVLPDRTSVLAAFLFMLALWWLVVALWARAGGFFGIEETGESASVFLSSYQVRDFASFFLQEVAASSDPAALGFYYIHHPNFATRLFTMAGIGLGMTQEQLILACFTLSVLSLLLAFLAFRRLFTPAIALAAVGFFATSYGVFIRQGGDLLRGPHAVMFWILLYLTALQQSAPLARTVGLNVALAALFFFIASSDWAFFIFCLVFYVMWHSYANRKIAFRHLFLWVFLPVALAFAGYFGVIIAHTGFSFFVIDALVSYFGRMGNVLAGPLLGQVWDPAQFLDLYRAKHIVMWDANPTPADLHDAVKGYWRIMVAGGAPIAGVLAAAILGCAAVTLLLVSRSGLVRGAALALWASLAFGFVPFGWVIVPIAYLFAGLPKLGARAAVLAGGEPTEAAPPALELAVWITVVLSALCAVALVFPNYVFWLWDRGVSPVGLADAAAFALVCHLLVTTGVLERPWSWLQASVALSFFRHGGGRLEPRQVAPGGAPDVSLGHGRPAARGLAFAAVVALAALHVAANYRLYDEFPPRGPSYAETLRKPEFHGKLFVANTYDALVWYFTRGTSLITTIVPPDLAESTKRYRHLRDADNDAKYSHPDYFLCDNDPYFSFQRIGEIDGQLCQMPKECTCSDFMRIMSKEGHTPVYVGPDYVIMKYNYPN